MSHMRSQHRMRFRLVCTVPGCGYATTRFAVSKDEDEQQAYLDLAHHNFKRHSGVFPRWNPEAKAIEQQRRKKVTDGVEATHQTADDPH